MYTDLGSSIFFNDAHVEPYFPIFSELKEDNEFDKRKEALEKKQNEKVLWTMYFDGSISKEGDGAGIWKISPNIYFKVYSYKLTFECTNNIAEYEDVFL